MVSGIAELCVVVPASAEVLARRDIRRDGMAGESASPDGSGVSMERSKLPAFHSGLRLAVSGSHRIARWPPGSASPARNLPEEHPSFPAESFYPGLTGDGFL